MAGRGLRPVRGAHQEGEANQQRKGLTAIQSKKKVKRTEIKIRQISLRLRNMKFDVDADDQPSVQAAVDKLEHYRAELFKSMFSMGDKDQ